MTSPRHPDRAALDISCAEISDEEWASSLAKRIEGQTGETWFANGIERAILVAVNRARADEREACALVCDHVSKTAKKPDNAKAADPRATFKSGAAKCAWEIRQRGKR